MKTRTPSHPCGTQFILKWTGPSLAERITIDGPDKIRAIWKEYVASLDHFDGSKEQMIVIGMNNRGHFLGWHLVAIGSATGVSMSWREVLRPIFAIDAQRVLLVHNHPSGVLLPSRSDEIFTRELAAILLPLRMEFIDHVIVDSEGLNARSLRVDWPDLFLLSAASASKPSAPAPPPVEVGRPPASLARPVEALSAEAGVKVKVTLPRPWVWNCPVWEIQEGLIGVASYASDPGAWVNRWRIGPGLRGFREKAKSFKKPLSREFIVGERNFKIMEAAARILEITTEELLVAFIGKYVAEHKARREAKENEPGNVLAFPR